MSSFQDVMQFFQQNELWTLIWVALTVFTVIASLYLLMKNSDSDDVVEAPRDVFAPIGAARSVDSGATWTAVAGGAVAKRERDFRASETLTATADSGLADATGGTSTFPVLAQYSVDLPDEDVASAGAYYVRAYGSGGLGIKVGALSLSADENKKLVFDLDEADIDPAPVQIRVYKY